MAECIGHAVTVRGTVLSLMPYTVIFQLFYCVFQRYSLECYKLPALLGLSPAVDEVIAVFKKQFGVTVA